MPIPFLGAREFRETPFPPRKSRAHFGLINTAVSVSVIVTASVADTKAKGEPPEDNDDGPGGINTFMEWATRSPSPDAFRTKVTMIATDSAKAWWARSKGPKTHHFDPYFEFEFDIILTLTFVVVATSPPSLRLRKVKTEVKDEASKAETGKPEEKAAKPMESETSRGWEREDDDD